jgi:hypothetical protein
MVNYFSHYDSNGIGYIWSYGLMGFKFQQRSSGCLSAQTVDNRLLGDCKTLGKFGLLVV